MRRPHDKIVVSPERRATFEDVDSLSTILGSRLRAEGHELHELIGLAIPNGPAFLAGFLALRRAGHAALLLDPLAPGGDRRRATETLGVSAVLECADAWPSSPDDFRLVRTGDRDGRSMRPAVAVVKLTSGSTGTPRGIAMPTDSLLADEDALTKTMGLRHEDRLWSAIPLSHSYGFTTLALSALVRGLTLVVPGHRDPFAALAAAGDLGATVFPTVPAYIQALLKLSSPPRWPASVRLVLSAGAPLAAETSAQFRETYQQAVHTFYGSSECGGICYDREGGAAERGTVGTPVHGARVGLVHQDQLPVGEGVVVVESLSVGEAYLPEGDARLAGGRFETSDVGTWQGGELALRQRLDRVINVRGRKVDPSEVEGVLSALDGVDEVVVLGMSSPDGREEIVHAVVVCRSARPRGSDVAAWCRDKLADHKVPRSVVFVEAIPRNSRGKVDRAALLSLYSANGDTGDTRD